MANFLVINDFNDINDAWVRHFSMDKGHFMAKSLAKLSHKIFFFTTKNDYVKDDINYISKKNITEQFIDTVNYILIPREPMLIPILKEFDLIKNRLAINKDIRSSPKFIIKSDSPVWFTHKNFISDIVNLFGVKKSRPIITSWVVNHIDFICAQNEDFCANALALGIPRKSLLISGMGISPMEIDFDKLTNPYDPSHAYCVPNAPKLGKFKALIPLHYLENPNQMSEFTQSSKKYILIYTGRIKSDSGRILFNMAHIMQLLGDDFELHIFPGSFIIPLRGYALNHSGKNAYSLEILRNVIFKNNKNVIVHFPYEHNDKYMYLHYADCGIDFSDARPSQTKSSADHAKILEYCEVGLPVVCEGFIHNSDLVLKGKNGIVLPYMASDELYADSIRKIIKTDINREFCRKMTIENENWDKKAVQLMEQITGII